MISVSVQIPRDCVILQSIEMKLLLIEAPLDGVMEGKRALVDSYSTRCQMSTLLIVKHELQAQQSDQFCLVQ